MIQSYTSLLLVDINGKRLSMSLSLLRMSQETYPRIDVHKILEAMDTDLEETKRNLTVLSATLDRKAIDRHYAEALRGLCGGGLLGLSLMMVAGLLTAFLFTILVYADSHAWIYLTKRRSVTQFPSRIHFRANNLMLLISI